MLGFLKSAGRITAVAACIAIAAAGSWYVVSSTTPPTSLKTAIGILVEQTAPNSVEKSSPGSSSEVAPKIASAPVTEAMPGATPNLSTLGRDDGAKTESARPDVTGSAQLQRPEFDIVRVEPSGDSVIAGRGVPGATIALVDGSITIARAVANSDGQVAFVPPQLAKGEHFLSLQMIQTGAKPVISSQSVTVSVPKERKDAPLVALTAPDEPTVVVSDGSASKPIPTVAATAPTDTPVEAIRTVEAEHGGSFFATGIAPPGSQTRLYLNGTVLGQVTTGPDGQWSLKVEKGMLPGSYVVRADEVEPASGKVTARAEVPFDFPAAMMASRGPIALVQSANPDELASSSAQTRSEPPSPPDGVVEAAPASAAAIIKELRTATVTRGDSLWRLSRKMLGRGIRYTQIYIANSGQIRDPRLVFPGQVFVMPQDPI